MVGIGEGHRVQGDTALPASGPRPVRARFFEFYRAPRIRSASAAVSPRHLPGPDMAPWWHPQQVVFFEILVDLISTGPLSQAGPGNAHLTLARVLCSERRKRLPGHEAGLPSHLGGFLEVDEGGLLEYSRSCGSSHPSPVDSASAARGLCREAPHAAPRAPHAARQRSGPRSALCRGEAAASLPFPVWGRAQRCFAGGWFGLFSSTVRGGGVHFVILLRVAAHSVLRVHHFLCGGAAVLLLVVFFCGSAYAPRSSCPCLWSVQKWSGLTRTPPEAADQQNDKTEFTSEQFWHKNGVQPTISFKPPSSRNHALKRVNCPNSALPPPTAYAPAPPRRALPPPTACAPAPHGVRSRPPRRALPPPGWGGAASWWDDGGRQTYGTETGNLPMPESWCGDNTLIPKA
eukprot:gene11007-biopygen18356